MAEYKAIGKNIARVDAVAKAAGTAVFSGDVVFAGMLHAKILRSPHSHAKINRIDKTRAEALPGVRAVLLAGDLPLNRSIGNDYGWILAETEVCYIGDPVALVAAQSEEIAEQALRLIEVEYEPLGVITSLEDAQKEDAPRVCSRYENNLNMRIHTTRGDVDGMFEKAHKVVSYRFHFPQVHQAHLEPNSAVATYMNGELTVYCASQVWFRLRADLAARLNLDESRVTVKPQHVGGAFGARNEQTVPVMAALLAMKCGRPVKLTHTREEEFYGAHPSVEMIVDMSLALDKEGRFLGRRTTYTGDIGAYAVAGGWVIGVACHRSDALYRFQAVEVTGLGIATNRAPTAAYRGYGNPQAHQALESIIDMAAEELHMDPAQIRLLNYAKENTIAINGYKISSCGVADCLKRAMELSGWDNKYKKLPSGRGIGLASLIHAAGSRAGEPEFAGDSALVRLEMSGRVTVLGGESEIGQGCKTVMAQIAAEELSIDPHDVYVVMGDTELSPFNTGTHGSKLTTILGNAVLFAAQDAKKQLLDEARLVYKTGRLYLKDGFVVDGGGSHVASVKEALYECCKHRNGLPFYGMGIYEPDAVMLDETGYGSLAPTYPFGVQVAEVSVNEQTGRIRVDKLVAVHDSGTIINPQMAKGQVYGGMTQAMGFTVMEGMHIDEKGLLAGGTFLEYKMPTILETPEYKVDFIQTNDPHGPYGAKSLGEPPIISVLPAVANAIYYATGLRLSDAPFTPKKVLKALKEREKDGKQHT